MSLLGIQYGDSDEDEEENTASRGKHQKVDVNYSSSSSSSCSSSSSSTTTAASSLASTVPTLSPNKSANRSRISARGTSTKASMTGTPTDIYSMTKASGSALFTHSEAGKRTNSERFNQSADDCVGAIRGSRDAGQLSEERPVIVNRIRIPSERDLLVPVFSTKRSYLPKERERRQSKPTPSGANAGGTESMEVRSGDDSKKKRRAEDIDHDLLQMAFLPPNSFSPCPHELQTKVSSCIKWSLENNQTFNQKLQSKKDFHNPYILEKIAKQYQIDNNGTNYPRLIFDPDFIEASDVYSEISLQQKKFELEWQRTHANALAEATRGISSKVESTALVPTGKTLPQNINIQAAVEAAAALVKAKQSLKT